MVIASKRKKLSQECQQWRLNQSHKTRQHQAEKKMEAKEHIHAL
jgi:hypothetical protein